MAWRFKASKYKNAAPIVPKPDMCVRDIIVGSYQNYGNNIAASGGFMAFNWEHAGTSVAVLPLDDCGRKSKTMPLLHAHSDTVTDLEFSPFHDGLLATGSQDCLVKIWHIPENGLTSSITNPECTFSHKQRRIERVGFHPTADCLLHSISSGTVILWDILKQDEAFSNNEHPEVIQSLTWKKDGTLFATTCKDKMVRVLDPRIASPIIHTADNHQSIKDSRVVWLGEQNRILTTGFDSARLRQVIVRDIRNFNKPEKTLELDCSTGILMPLFDSDTNMLLLAGKGDSTISYLEVTDKEPYFIEGLRHTGEQTKGACLVPKKALRVMEGEVNRILQLTSNSVIPIMYQVPRKTYRDFHSDLYPDTVDYSKSELTASQWLSGKNQPLQKMSLDPAKRDTSPQATMIHRGTLMEMVENLKNSSKSGSGAPAKKVPNNNIIEERQFIPIKAKIRQMEETSNGKPLENISTKQTKNEDNLKRSSFHQNGNNTGTTLVMSEEKTDNSKPEEMIPDDNVDLNKNSAPTPLPRTSRTNSINDPSSSEESSTSSVGGVRPNPKPRVSVGAGYKPRLGPKPFMTTTAADNFSFDKVFSVPQVPGVDSKPSQEEPVGNNGSVEEMEEIVEEEPKVNVKPENGIHKIDDEATEGEKEMNGEGEEKVELRQVIKKTSKEGNDNEDEVDDKINRESVSIADRRKLYEFRSMSIQEEKNSPTPLRRRNSLKQSKTLDDVPENNQETVQSQNTNGKRTSTVFGRVSKYRHLKGTPGHKSTQIDNVRNISRQIPGECDGFQANHERVAVPLAGAGGKIAVYELSKTGRLPDGVIPSLVNGSNIMDFQWDPFNPRRLAVACDDGTVKFWIIPDEGLKEPVNTPNAELMAHSDKIYFIKFHPCAKDVLLTGSYDMTMKIWNVNDLSQERVCLKGHTDQIFGFAWSPCGNYGATVCRDGKVRIYEPRKTDEPIAEGTGPAGTRGARIVWTIDGEYLVITGFDKVSERQISIYKRINIKAALNTVGLDVSPAILVPFYDEDSSTLFVTGKGDSTIFAFDITDESPYICPLSHHRATSAHQGLSFLSKNQCNVTIVEFAKALRLTNSSIEWLSFTVPRLKSELFQDDLFPNTRVTWESSMMAEEWFDVNFKDRLPIRISLQPEGMLSLTSSRPIATVAPTQPIQNQAQHQQAVSSDPMDFNIAKIGAFDSRKQKEQDLKNALSSRMEANLDKVEHDKDNGVEDEEWDEN